MLYLDSADPKEVEKAAEVGCIHGVTTNPTLMRPHADNTLAHLEDLLQLFGNGPVFYQPTNVDPEEAEREVRAALEIAPQRVVAKLPARLDHVRLAAKLSGEGSTCALTAVFSPAQALLAHQSGCRYVIPYIDRAARDGSGGHDLIRRLTTLLRSLHSETSTLAASVKSVGQAISALEEGAHGVSVPMAVVEALDSHPLTDAAIASFAEAYPAPTSQAVQPAEARLGRV